MLSLYYLGFTVAKTSPRFASALRLPGNFFSRSGTRTTIYGMNSEAVAAGDIGSTYMLFQIQYVTVWVPGQNVACTNHSRPYEDIRHGSSRYILLLHLSPHFLSLGSAIEMGTVRLANRRCPMGCARAPLPPPITRMPRTLLISSFRTVYNSVKVST